MGRLYVRGRINVVGDRFTCGRQQQEVAATEDRVVQLSPVIHDNDGFLTARQLGDRNMPKPMRGLHSQQMVSVVTRPSALAPLAGALEQPRQSHALPGDS